MKVAAIIIAIALVGSVVGFLLLNSGSDEESSSDNSSSSSSYTLNEVSTHNSKSDCWTIVDDTVYDITEYIPRHPGGDDILDACGTDGSSLFNTRMTDDGERVGSGTPHSNTANTILNDYKIGDLAQ